MFSESIGEMFPSTFGNIEFTYILTTEPGAAEQNVPLGHPALPAKGNGELFFRQCIQTSES